MVMIAPNAPRTPRRKRRDAYVMPAMERLESRELLSALAVTGLNQVSRAQSGYTASGVASAPVMSSDGRFTVFSSTAALVAIDTNASADVYLYDRSNNQVTLLSGTGSAATGGASYSISSDGRYVAFETAGALVGGDTNGVTDVYVRDNVSGNVAAASVNLSATIAGGADAMISGNGRFVAFAYSNNVYRRDLGSFVSGVTSSAATTLVSVTYNAAAANGISAHPAISADGNMVAFLTAANNLLPSGDSGSGVDLYTRDISSGTTKMGTFLLGITVPAQRPQISDDGVRVGFSGSDGNLYIDRTDQDTVQTTVWSASTSSYITTTNYATLAVDTAVSAYALAKGGGYVVYQKGSASIRADLSTLTYTGVTKTTVATTSSTELSITADGTRILYLNSGQAYLWNSGTATQVSVVSNSTGAVASLNASVTGLSLSSGSSNWMAFASAATNAGPFDNNAAADVMIAHYVGTNNAPLGSIDVATATRFAGWVFDPDSGATAISMRLDIDGAVGTPVYANLYRADLISPLGSAYHGFDFTPDASKLGPGTHTLALYAYDSAGVDAVYLGSTTVTNAAPIGNVDGYNRTAVAGWAIDPDAVSPTSPLGVVVYVDVPFDAAHIGAQGLANVYRPDVDSVYHTGAYHGYSLTLNSSLITAGTHTLYIFAADSQTGLLTLLNTVTV